MIKKLLHFIERYRDDDKNSLEFSGNQINNNWNGPIISYNPESGLKEKEEIFNYGQKGNTILYFDTKLDEKGEQKKLKKEEWKENLLTTTFFEESEDVILKGKYHSNGNLDRSWFCSGERKGECTVFYNNSKHRIQFKMTADENGIGQGYFERYRDDNKNSLDLTGNQIDGNFDGKCTGYDTEGNPVENIFFENGRYLYTKKKESTLKATLRSLEEKSNQAHMQEVDANITAAAFAKRGR